MTTFQPERVGPALLAQAHRSLTEAGLHVAHLAICYDGQEDAESYSIGHHLHPVGHEPGHRFILANALRSVAPDMEYPQVKGMQIVYYDDGTVAVVPLVMSDPEEDEE